MKLWRVRNTGTELEPTRGAYDPQLSLNDYLQLLNEFTYNGVGYATLGGGITVTSSGQKQEQIGPTFRSLSQLAYKTNGVVFACMLTRMLHFTEARFQFRNLQNGRPGKLFGTTDLQPLETPWEGGTTGDLLARMIQHADLGGNAFVVARPGNRLATLRPDWVTLILGVQGDPEADAWASDAEILGYIYQPGGPGSGNDLETFLPEEVAHFAPIPDPDARFRGMSWLTPLIREVMGDKAMTDHKVSYFENGTNPNLLIKLDIPDLQEMQEWITAFKEQHEGALNAFKTVFLANGADATPIGTNLKDLDYKLVQGAGETRIAAAARTPPVIVGLSEGLQGSSLNTGNYQAARRMFADGCMRPLWRNAAASLARIINVPGGAELWYDDRDVAFLKEDQKDAADIQLVQAQAIRQLVDAGFKPDDVVAAIEAHDFSLLEHSGLFSVQLQAANAPKQGLFTGTVLPNTNDPIPSEDPGGASANANGSKQQAAA